MDRRKLQDLEDQERAREAQEDERHLGGFLLGRSIGSILNTPEGLRLSVNCRRLVFRVVRRVKAGTACGAVSALTS